MKKVVKVSIGTIAFTVEEDGYLILKGYLEELNDHYRGMQNGNEIVEGIEERIAELFLEKAGGNTVITSAVVNDVIQLLGRPEVIDEESNESSYSRRATPPSGRVIKRLYRDPDNKMIGGVCSGIAAYFNIDTAIVRVIFLVLMFFSWVPFVIIPFPGVHGAGGSFIFLAYIIMWIAIPEARTVHQKFAMRGEKPDLSNIQRNVERSAQRMGRDLRRAGRNSAPVVNDIFIAISKVFAVILVLISVGGILLFSFLFLGIEIFNGFIPADIINYVEIGLTNTFWLKLTTLAFLFLPLLGMLYGGIKILFEFRNLRFRPGLIMFILWIISGFASATLAIKASRPYWENAREVSDIPVTTTHDTLYLNLEYDSPMPDKNLIIEGDKDELFIFWADKNGVDKKFVVFPEIRIERDIADSSRYMRLRTNSFGYTSGEAIMKAQRNLPLVEMTDSLVTVRPDVYSTAKKWDGTNKRITLYIPENVKVMLKNPIRFGFDGEIEINNGFNFSKHRAPYRPW